MPRHSKARSALLWTAQATLCLLFLFAGGFKLVAPLAMLQQGPLVLPGAFLRAIGVLEVLGALGLVLPGLFRIRRELVPLAAVGLAGIMAGAATISILAMGIGAGAVPAVIGLLAIAIGLGRRDQAPVFIRRRAAVRLAPATAHH